MKRAAQQLRRGRAFEPLELQYLASVITVLEFTPGEVLLVEGEAATFCALILSGALASKIMMAGRLMKR